MKKEKIGIIAKMAINKSKLLGLTMLPFESTDELWIDLLKLKYQIPYYQKILLSTGDKYLLEFSRSAKKLTLANDPPYWTGLIDEDQQLYGTNKMGQYHMMIRQIYSGR